MKEAKRGGIGFIHSVVDISLFLIQLYDTTDFSFYMAGIALQVSQKHKVAIYAHPLVSFTLYYNPLAEIRSHFPGNPF
jgi:hypothetical protein